MGTAAPIRADQRDVQFTASALPGQGSAGQDGQSDSGGDSGRQKGATIHLEGGIFHVGEYAKVSAAGQIHWTAI
jgi:hypothetical protein